MTTARLAPSSAGDAEALAQIIRQVGAAKSSFFTAMRLLPLDRRNAMFAIYAFCREVDDIADEPGMQEGKQRELDAWRDEIETIYRGEPATKLVGRALVAPIRRFGLLKSDFLAVIDGMAMDAERDIQAPNWAELDLYCARVASAVGRLSVRAFGEWQPEADDVADHLGRALQLTNILRDLDEDAARFRLYLPREALLKQGIETTRPAEVLAHPGLSRACAEVVTEARRRFDLAYAAMAACPKATMRPAWMMAGVYAATLDRLVKRGWTAPRAAVRVPSWLKLWIALRHGFFSLNLHRRS